MTSIHVLRYKDVNERMETLYPYFLYSTCLERRLDSLPVTDGMRIPIGSFHSSVGFDSSSVPWSAGNPFLRLVGYGVS